MSCKVYGKQDKIDENRSKCPAIGSLFPHPCQQSLYLCHFHIIILPIHFVYVKFQSIASLLSYNIIYSILHCSKLHSFFYKTILMLIDKYYFLIAIRIVIALVNFMKMQVFHFLKCLWTLHLRSVKIVMSRDCTRRPELE